MSDVTVLDVRLYGDRIGALTLLPGERTLFAFTDEYIHNTQRPTLSLSFKDQLGGLITEIAPTRTRLAPFFSNLLPEGALRGYLANRAGVKEQREFFLLWVLGQDLPGAVTIAPASGQVLPESTGDSEYHAGRSAASTALRFSLAGVQLKFSAVMAATGGLTVPATGIGGSWIVKLPSSQFAGVPENEFAMMTLARHIGINVPDVELIETQAIAGLPPDIGRISGRALAVRRFDRDTDGAPLHIEDFAQVFGVYPDRKYERASYRNIAEVLWAETGGAGIVEFVRRLVFNVLIGNADMHLKNWSLLYRDRRAAAMAPAYDLVSTIAFIDDANMALNLVKSKAMTAVSRETLAHFAAKARLPEKMVLSTATETVQKFIDLWTREKTHLPLTRAMIDAIDNHMKKLALLA